MTYSYNLNLDGLEVTAVLTFNGFYGLLLCSFDDRAISVRLGSQREYMREDACRALKSRRVMADMIGEAPYSRKATCRAIANRLDLLETQMEIEAGEAPRIIAEVKTKWRGLQTAHDFDRFVSTNAIAKQHLALCKRTDNDFENLIAPALAKAIKEDIETDLETGAPVLGAASVPVSQDDDVLAELALKVKGVLAFHDLAPFESITDGIDVLDETVADLRECLAESDDLASDRWNAISGVNDVLCSMLDTRGVPTSEHVGENLRAVVEYLSAVETAAVKWQAAGLAWQEKSTEAVPWGIPRTLFLTSHKPTRFVETLSDTTAGIEPVYSETYEHHYVPAGESPLLQAGGMGRRCNPWTIDRNGPAPEVASLRLPHGDVSKETLRTYLQNLGADDTETT